GYLVLSELTGKQFRSDTKLALPEAAQIIRPDSLPKLRPRYKLFKSQINVLKTKKALTKTDMLPSISAFGTASYGRPGLNILNDDFHGFYIVGLQIKWGFWDLFNSNRKQQVLQIKQQQVKQDRLAFDVKIRSTLARINQQIQSLQKNIERDHRIVSLRENIVQQSAQQLKHGVITSTEYVTELTKANKARLSLFINRVKLAQEKTKYETILGLPVKK
ncbi:MAG TPA: TolC family protein, partial [Balneolaceae bacterium]|nr:TolC family protein [Balneolaceae bacterium]